MSTPSQTAHKVYYGIGEVADLLGVPVSCVRYWANTFENVVKPRRNKKGDRFFTQRDVTSLKKIRYLTKECGLTLQGVKAKLDAERYVPKRSRPAGRPPKTAEAGLDGGVGLVDRDDIVLKAEVVSRLSNVRDMLLEISSYL